MADGIIDSISIEIDASPEKAVEKLNNLADAIRNVAKASRAKYGTGLSDLLEALNKSDTSGIEKVTRLMSELKAVGKVSLGTSLAKQIKGIADAANDLSDDAARKITELTKALERLKGVDLGGFSRVMRREKTASEPSTVPSALEPQPAFGGPQMKLSVVGNTTDDDIRKIFMSYHEIGAAAEEAKGPVTSLISKIHEFGQGAKSAFTEARKAALDMGKTIGSKSVIGAINGLMRGLGRIATYRAIRSAIKFVTDAMKEGTENAYYFSKAFETIEDGTMKISEAYDQIATANFKMTNQLGAAWASLVRAITPIILQIISYVTRLADTMTQVFAVFAGRSTYLKAIDYNKEWGESATKAAKAAKEWKNQLMGFDEINRLEAPADSTRGLTGDNTPDYGQMFEMREIEDRFKKIQDKFETLKELISNHLDDIKKIAIGAELGLGLILLLTGANIPLGLALTVAGLVRLYKGINEDWDWANKTLSQKLSDLAFVVSGALLAVGAVLLFSGANVPLGLGLLAAGAMGMAATAAISWDDMPNNIRSTIGEIMLIAGASMFAIGLILTLATPGFSAIGLGLMAAGAAAFTAGVAIDWKSTSGNIQQVLGDILTVAGASLFAIGLILTLTSIVSAPIGIGLMIAGATAFGAGQVALNWDYIKTQMSGTLGEILMIAGGALAAIGVALLLAGPATMPLGLGMILAGAGIFGVAASQFDWESLKQQLSGTLGEILMIAGLAIAAIGIILLFTGAGAPLGIGMIIAGAGIFGVAAMNYDWDALGNKIKGKLEEIKTNFNDKWTEIRERTVEWWEDLKKDADEKLEDIRKKLKEWIEGIWEKLTGWLRKIRDKIIEWWDNIFGDSEEGSSNTEQEVTSNFRTLESNSSSSWENIKNDISSKWDSIKATVSGKVHEVVEEAKGKFEEMKNDISDKMTSILNDVTSKWESIKSTVSDILSSVKSSAVDAFDNVKNTVGNKIDEIKDKMNFDWSLPTPKLPSVGVQWNDTGLGGIKIPSFSVDWGATGGILDSATLIGAGEAGREALLPLDRNKSWMSDVAREMVNVGNFDGGDTAGAVEESGEEIVATLLNCTMQIIEAMRDNSGDSMDVDGFVRQITKIQRRQARAAGTL